MISEPATGASDNKGCDPPPQLVTPAVTIDNDLIAAEVVEAPATCKVLKKFLSQVKRRVWLGLSVQERSLHIEADKFTECCRQGNN